MKEPTILRCARGRAFAAACLVAVTATPRVASADESGVSFWLPGFFGSLAVAPHVARAREFQIGKIPVNLTANVSANVDARADLALAMPNYTFATPVFGGQLTVGAIGIYGRVDSSLAGTVTGALSTPLGTLPFSRSDSISDFGEWLRRCL